jgi:hypothetical protein
MPINGAMKRYRHIMDNKALETCMQIFRNLDTNQLKQKNKLFASFCIQAKEHYRIEIYAIKLILNERKVQQ